MTSLSRRRFLSEAAAAAALPPLASRGPVGLQHYGIKGDAKVNLQRSMTAWREMSRKVWPATGPEKR